MSSKKYVGYLFRYGILSVLYALEYFESIENYNECASIIEAIRSQEERLDTELFTIINSENIGVIIETYHRFHLTGVNLIENSKYCSKLIIADVFGKLE